MPFTMDWMDQGVRFGGYDDGADWVVVPTGGQVREAGFVGDRTSATRAWAVTGPRNGHGDGRVVVVLDVPARSKVGSIPFESIESDRLLVSRDGKRVHVVTRRYEGSPGKGDYRYLGVEIVVINTGSGAVASRHPIDCSHVSLYRQVVVETADERIRLPVSIAAPKQGESHKAIATLDPRSDAVSLASLPDSGHYVWLSPRGRFALRPNLASLPIRDEATSSLAGIRIGRKERYYGLCLQLWEVEPVRYIRTIPVAWLTYEELPDNAQRGHKRSAYEAIRMACDSLAPDAHGAPPLTADLYPTDPTRKVVSAIHWEFAERLLNNVVWAEDEQAFWVEAHGFWSWASVEGATSPRIRLERTGMKSGMAVPFADGPHLLELLGGRQARFVFRSWRGSGRNGSAIVEAQLPSSFRPIQVCAQGGDRWQEADLDSAAVHARIQTAVRAMQLVEVSLTSLSAQDCIKAIATLDKKLRTFVEEAMTRGSIDFSFEVAGRSLGEEAFFQHIEANVPEAAPELRKLIERLVSGWSLPDDGRGLPFSDGWQLLGPAVKALGVLDRSALVLIGQYGRRLDRGHENYFSRCTLPAIVKAHGWTAEVVDLGLAMLLTGFNVASSLWRGGGMGAAVAASTSPQDFAARIFEAMAREQPPEESFRFGHPMIYQLWREIAPRTPWEERLFSALEATVPEYDYPTS
jgi:hypothetical protein